MSYYSITEAENGWKRLSVTFEVDQNPKQTMTASFWVKSDVVIPTLEAGAQPTECIQHAEVMHKEEHRKTFNQGLMSNFQNFEDYYNETFNTKEK